MKRDQSYGIIPLDNSQGVWMVFLVKHQAGHWAFPKGHLEKGETPRQAAERELFEETGLSVKEYLHPDSIVENYMFKMRGELVSKRVDYFIAQVEGEAVIQLEEIEEGRWVTLEEAAHLITFKEAKRICQHVFEMLNSKHLA